MVSPASLGLGRERHGASWQGGGVVCVFDVLALSLCLCSAGLLLLACLCVSAGQSHAPAPAGPKKG